MSFIGNLSFALQEAGAQAQDGGFGGSPLVSYLLLFAVLGAVMYFMLIRPEKKRRQKMQGMINELKPGDKIITIGGIHGTVSGVTDKAVVVRIADQVKIEITKQAVGTVVTPETESESEKK